MRGVGLLSRAGGPTDPPKPPPFPRDRPRSLLKGHSLPQGFRCPVGGGKRILLIIFNLIYCTYLGRGLGRWSGEKGPLLWPLPLLFYCDLSVSLPPTPTPTHHPHPIVVWMWFYFLSVSPPLFPLSNPLCSHLPPSTCCLLLFLGLLYNSTCIHCVHTTSQTKTQWQTLDCPAGVALSCGVWAALGGWHGQTVWN